jgi:formiminotetrahydrofolate cyclodeaminase
MTDTTAGYPRGREPRPQGDDLAAFLRVLDPADNAVGGGTASAVAGAMAAALTAMVARLSRSRPGMAPDAHYEAIAAEAEALAGALMAGGEEDARAFDRVMAARRLSRATAAEQAARREAIQEALFQAARTPLENGARCRRVLELRRALEGRSNASAASDLTCAGHLAAAGLRGCLDNVRINLPALEDPERIRDLEHRTEELERFLAHCL